MSKSELKDRLTDAISLYNIPGVGKGRFNKLVKTYKTPGNVLSASISSLSNVSGIFRQTASAINSKVDLDTARETASRIIQLGWEVMFLEDIAYPSPLKVIDTPPPMLFSIGNKWSESEKIIAIVGTRRASERGKQFTFNLAMALAQAGITVISGMAEGIDSSAHKGALNDNGKTMAVWGTSLDIVYPSSNRELAMEIRDNGTIFSEYLPGRTPDKGSFPERNRIISALSRGVVVVEASIKSGALITVNHAIEQGKEVFAVPGFPNNKNTIGTNELIKKGAKLLTRVEDIFDELPTLKGEIVVKKYTSRPDMTKTEREILELFGGDPIQIDNISRSVNMPISELMEFMLALELKGVLREISGKRFILTEQNV